MRIYNRLDVMSDFGGRFPWRSHFFDTGDGVRQAFVDEGPRDAELTFLLLHGNPTWSFLYRRFIERLCRRHRIIAVDHVGFGRSDKPRDPAYYSLERHIRNLGGLLEHVGARHVVPVMQDWGGPTGMGWATRHPERVAGVVVLNTFAFVREPRQKLPWLFKFLALGRGGWKRSTRDNFFVELFMAKGGPRKLSDDDLNPYRAPFPTPEDRIGVARFPQLIPETERPTHETWATMAAIEDALPGLREKKALVCWAEKDRAFGKKVLARWLQVFATVDGPHRLPRAGHFLQEDEPEIILDYIERWAAGVAAEPGGLWAGDDRVLRR
jgi:haloalkane dehalogenase